MKKIITSILATMLALVAVFSASACGSKKNIVVYSDILLTQETYAFAVQKSSPLKAQVNTILADMQQSGELDTIINSFFDGTATFEYTNPASKEGCFVVATNAYFPPFEYHNGSKFTGIDMKIAYEIAQDLGKTLYIQDQTFDTLITTIQNGQADIAMAGMTVTSARLLQVDFTDGYYESAQVISVAEGCTLFDGCTTATDVEAVLAAQDTSFVIGTQVGTTGYMYSKGDQDFGYTGFSNLTTKSYDTGALAMQDLANGKISAVILDKQPSLMIQKSMNNTDECLITSQQNSISHR